MLLKTMIKKMRKELRKMKILVKNMSWSALTGSVSPGNETWLVDSGASKYMTGYKDSLSCLV